MAPRMLPSRPSGDAPESEVKFFRRLEEECPEDWTIIHSLGLAEHRTKAQSEADFVVVNSRGVLVIEVKGGAVRRESQTWYSGDQSLKESPLKQATGASEAIRDHLVKKHVGRGLHVEGVVAIPDVLLRVDALDIDRDRIGDAKALDGSLAEWITTAQEKSVAKLKEKHPRLEFKELDRQARERVVDALAGDFELVPSLAAAVGEADREMIRFTDEQAHALEIAEDNPRVVIDGGAGTGKTVLAAQHARSLAARSRRVLLVCFNAPLALRLHEDLVPEGVDVFHFHGLTYHLLDLAGMSRPEKGEDADLAEYYDRVLPEAAMAALAELEDPPLYDCLIVDEGQDLLYDDALSLLDVLLDGGLDSGEWCFFRDSKQDIYGKQTAAAEERLMKAHPAKKVLKVNCRNTGEIARTTAACSGREPAPTLPVSGPEVEAIHFEELTDLKKSSAKVLRRWLAEGIEPGRIVVLDRHRRERGAWADGFPTGLPAKFEDLNNQAGGEQDPDAIRFATIHSFKGLEADAILLLNVGDLDDEDTQKLLYVGMSRARLVLAVGVPARQRERFAAALKRHNHDA